MKTYSYNLVKPVSIIIVTWNCIEYTKQCLKTLFFTLNNYNHNDIEIIVVDNGSSDGTLEYIKTINTIKLIPNKKNLGFSKANNIALKQARIDSDIILLNNDIEIYQNNWIYKLQQCANIENNIGLVGCRLSSFQNNARFLMHAGTYMPIETLWGQQIGGEKDINQYSLDREVEGVVFACSYIKREVIEKVGYLDEDFFAYFEDTDYCFRVKEKGYKVYYCGNVDLIHHQNVSTSVNKVSHNKIFIESQKIFEKKWIEKLKKIKYFLNIDWHSIINFKTGYAISSREIALALDRNGVKVNYQYVYGENTPFPIMEPVYSDNYMINCIRDRQFGFSDIQVVYAQGDVFKKNTGKYKIGYTMLETDKIPDEWVKQCNLMNEVWVPSNFNKETFIKSGVDKPIFVMPLGVDINYFNPYIKGYSINEVFTFLSIFEWGERKAPDILLKAFNDEFSIKEDAILILKIFNNDPTVDVYKQIKDLNLNRNGGRIILSINEIVPSYQIGSLYRSCNCFVLPTRGEGWGMPILEAMACGIPVIATNWSAQTEFMTTKNSFPLEIDGLILAKAKCPYYNGFKWAQPSYEHLRYLLRYVYENREEAKKIGEMAAKDVVYKWTWDNTVKKIIKRISAIY